LDCLVSLGFAQALHALELQGIEFNSSKTLQFRSGNEAHLTANFKPTTAFSIPFRSAPLPESSPVQVDNRIDWNRFQVALEDCYSPDLGALAKSVRVIVGLHYLKHAFNLCGEAVLQRWVENP
jgi:hypothetical protein